MVEPVDNIYYALNLEEFSIDMNVVNVCDTFSNSTSQAIPDGTGTPQNPDFQTPIFSSITIPNDITNISDINISINATHNEVNDMLFQLQNADPNNDSFVNLWLFNCSGQSTIDVTFNDNGTPLPTPGSTTCGNPITGLFAPADTNTSIADVFATGTQSEFLLAAADFISGDTGTLNSWEIEICSTTFSVADNSINGFTISPNPNQGIFNIRFNQPIAENSKISIYDFQGRLIENLDYSTGSIEQQIQLKNQYQSGVYLIEVSNENGKSVNKLIIK
jgi:subtilisin-like proprotein convertase family protein